MAKEKSFYELSKNRTLNNVELAEWLRSLEDQVKQGAAAKKSAVAAKPEEKAA